MTTANTNDSEEDYDNMDNSDAVGLVVEEEEENVGRKAAWGTLLNCSVRVLSFLFSQLTLRMLDPQILGRASIEFELLLNTSLFIGREGFRLALTKEQTIKTSRTKREAEEDECARVCWMSVPSGIGLSLLCLSYHLYVSKNEVDDYKYAGIMYCLAAALESFSEPHVIYSMKRMDVSSRAKSQAIAIFVKSLATIALLHHPVISKTIPMTAMGLAQLLYGLTLACCQIYFMQPPPPPPHYQLFTTTNRSSSSSTGVYKKLVWNFTAQSLFKHALTQGDRIVLTALRNQNPTAMGSYAMAKNYGGIVSRFLFSPMEENSRLLFSACIHQKNTREQQQKQNKKDHIHNHNNSQMVHDLRNAYVVILKLVVYIGAIFASFASNYTYVLIHILLGRSWSSNPSAVSSLSAFCVYTSILAMNGITEAFVYGTIVSAKSIRQLMMVHGVIGAFYYTLLAPPLLRRYEATGIILANGISMSMRISFSLYFATDYFATTYNTTTNNHNIHKGGRSYIKRMVQQFQFIMKHALPHPIIILFFISSYAITKQSSKRFYQMIQRKFQNDDDFIPLSLFLWLSIPHILVGITCLVLTSIAMYLLEKSFGKSLRTLLQERRKEKQQ